MKISIVVATTENNVIGKNGKIPWHIPDDLIHFKELTMGHHILMGRTTHESIGKALPGRTNLILSNDNNYSSRECFVFSNLADALDFAREHKEDELMVVGGEKVYNITLPLAERIYMTRILINSEGDTYFPELNPNEWDEVFRETHLESEVPYEFRTMERRRV